MEPQDSNQANSQQPTIRNPLSVMQPDESIICEIKRHPIGMLSIYVVTGVLLLLLAMFALVVLPSILSSVNRSQVEAIGGLIFLVIAVLTLVFVFISNKVYWGNSWVVTSDSITQIKQTSLFDKSSSQLALDDLEDVTAEQKGILAKMLNYGLLRVETAGERSKFMFPYCPNPNYYAQQILSAREQLKQSHYNNENNAEDTQPQQ